ncbi:uncharacterized protein LOC111891719 [Lactuca sativa]|uniref:uncharacterized protein LOC111891719 n=1 Tax=Lactuca sativa TaxID=4236 RepID=UPI0022AF815B|nr:uncharacterized protein LOC111891719 [Lactuca sativa]
MGDEQKHQEEEVNKDLGVANVVGGWDDLGIDDGKYAHELILNSGIDVINFDDSGFMVVRDGCSVFRSPAQHDFNFTYQLEKNGTKVDSQLFNSTPIDQALAKNETKNAPKNNQLICPKIQKELVQCFAQEVLLSIRQEIGQDVFALLVDESSDVSKKEQMAIVLRYVDSLGFVKERFIGVVHVKDTSSLKLKNALNEVLTSNKLSFSQIRGQGYDGASNMRGEFNGLKALILKENDTAFYVHCFAHQLQLVVVAVAKKHDGVSDFFEQISLVVNVVCASCKRKDLLREQARQRVQKGLGSGELETGRGLNQKTTLVRAGDTRWGSHFNTLTSLMKLFADVLVVLEFVKVDEGSLANRQQASGILAYFQSYEFVFYLYMMYEILHLTGTLSKQLQKKI